MPKDKKNGDKDSFIVAFGVYGAVGFQLAIAVVAGVYLGNLGDRHFDTTPWLTIVGVIIGSGGGFYNLIRIMNWSQKRKEK